MQVTPISDLDAASHFSPVGQKALRPDQSLCFLSGRCGDLSIAIVSFAVPAIDTDRHRPVDRHAAHDASLVALRRAIVPDRHIVHRHHVAQHGELRE